MTFLTNSNNPQMWEDYSNKGKAALKSGRYSEAEHLLSSALKLAEKFGESDVRLLESLKNLAQFYATRGETKIADNLYSRALGVALDSLGSNHPQTQAVNNALEELRRKRDIPPATVDPRGFWL